MKSLFKTKDSIYEHAYKVEEDSIGNDIVYHKGMSNATYKTMRNDFLRIQKDRWFSGVHSNTYVMMLITLFGNNDAK